MANVFFFFFFCIEFEYCLNPDAKFYRKGKSKVKRDILD